MSNPHIQHFLIGKREGILPECLLISRINVTCAMKVEVPNYIRIKLLQMIEKVLASKQGDTSNNNEDSTLLLYLPNDLG